MDLSVSGHTALHRVSLSKECYRRCLRTYTVNAPAHGGRREQRSSIVVRAGTSPQAPSSARAQFPEIPKGPDNTTPDWFLNLYKNENTVVPWDTGKEQPLIVKAVAEGFFAERQPVIDLGCGFGTNTIYMGAQGLDVIGIDLSPDAIAEAHRRLAAAGEPATTNVEFKAGSVLDLPELFGERKFASALDSALYHCLDDEMKEKYLAALHTQLVPGAKLMLIAMSDRNPAEGWIGPRRISEADIRNSLCEDAGWRIESLNMDEHYEVPATMKDYADAPPQFAKGFGHALVAVATRV